MSQSEDLPNEMNAVVVCEPNHLEVRPIAVPEPGPFEAFAKIEVCGLCGTTDRHLVAGTQPHHPPDRYPAVLGHESVGTVVAIGEKVRNFQVGDRVTRVCSIWPDDVQDGLYSAWGGFAEYGIVRDRMALVEAGHDEYEGDWTSQRQLRVPGGLDPLDASLAISLSELGSWMWKLGAVGGRSMVVGGTGLAGYAICQFAKLAGAQPIIAMGRRDERLELARQFGADEVVNMATQDAPGVVRELTGGGADIFAEATGVDEVFTTGLRVLRANGCAAIYGAPVGYRYSLPMKGTAGEFSVRLIGPEEYRAYGWVCRLIREGKIDTSLFRSHVWEGLDKVSDALAAQSNGEVVKSFVRIGEV